MTRPTPAQLDARIAAIDPPRGVSELAARLEDAGFETWCVGGAIRDALLGLPSLDWDLATAAHPEDVRRVFGRIVPKGIEFGTVGVFDTAGAMHEVTTFRHDVETDGRHAVVRFGVTLDDDLARRDFTINAIAYSPRHRRLHDPFGGTADLRRGVVRAVGIAARRMEEDRLRALRAIRFAARFGFALDESTWQAIVDSGPHLGRLSPERVREELEKTMQQVDRPSSALERWRTSGALAALIPSLHAATPVAFATPDGLPRAAGEHASQQLWNRLAALWLDTDRATAEGAARALRCSNQQTRWIADLVERWGRVGAALRAGLMAPEPPDDAQLRRWAARMGRTLTPAVLEIAGARFAAERAAGLEAPGTERVREVAERLVSIAYRDPIEAADLAVTGRDLIAAGFAPGPGLGTILLRLLAEVVRDPAANVRERLLALAASEADGTSAPGSSRGASPNV